MNADSVIGAEGLVKRYGQIEAVSGIDLDVRPREIFGFLGPNGAGKSTTINILCTLARPTAGQARVAGFDVEREPDAVRAAIGLVFQDPSLDSQLTARENLQFHAFIYGVPAAERARRITQALQLVELSDRADALVRTYSGGMRRRLEIARAMLHTPAVLFLDEPTIGLDPQTRRRIWAYLHRLRDQAGVTLFLTTHYMDEAEECDRIAIIDHGRIVALGTPSQLKALVGGDVVTLATEDGTTAAAQIRSRFGLQPRAEHGSIRVEVSDGAGLIPRLLRELSVPVRSVSARQPSLDDAFLKLTGHAIRDEQAGRTDRMRMMRRAWGGRR